MDFLNCAINRIHYKQNTFGDLSIAKNKQVFCGVVALHLPSGRLVGNVRYLTTCEEIYDIAILPNLHRPGILGIDNPMHRNALTTPTDFFWSR
ncbi:DUF4915 domain-containing protein [Candidatus Parabeggiatoa sp. HSG14]|uniref:DUF4915 domain-containing protein n=1 Tax=Candidatus Parabeggiatoa sp. HSG14 TaxID=3055593 RepID=UPI0032E50410